MNYRSYVVKGLLLLVVSLGSGCAALGIGAAGGATAGAIESERASKSYGPGVTTVAILSDAVYLPAKVVFAGAGTVVSGVAYLVTLGNKEITRDIFNSSVQGDYLVTPAMIAGDKRVRFVG